MRLFMIFSMIADMTFADFSLMLRVTFSIMIEATWMNRTRDNNENKSLNISYTNYITTSKLYFEKIIKIENGRELNIVSKA